MPERRKPTPATPAVKQFKETVSEEYRGGSKGWNKPQLPPPPTAFQADPPVVGDAEFARMAHFLLNLDPVAKKSVKMIVNGPTDASMTRMMDSQLPIDSFEGTSLAGIYDPKSHAIGVQPNLGLSETLMTLLHEIGHASGLDEGAAQRLEQKVRERK